ncbi:MAG TPA: type II toxin-antitoxin system RelE/ParE family toxin [Pirellulales bacterium]|jgi:plasmid stabilization system protein ParE|nr:type II toxin-antitoxin system RelE/ParE family toxin [Pirellulales bacterium]
MKRRVIFRHEAEIEFNEAACWYEARRRNLGREFIAAVEETIDLIRARPELFRIVAPKVREAEMKRFPYSVIYHVKDNEILIVGVFHGSRDPAQWRKRL